MKKMPNFRAENMNRISNWPLYLIWRKCQTQEQKKWIKTPTDNSILCEVNAKLKSWKYGYNLQLTTPSHMKNMPNFRADNVDMIYNWPLHLMWGKCQTLDLKIWIWSSTDHSILCEVNAKLYSRKCGYKLQLTTPSYVR